MELRLGTKEEEEERDEEGGEESVARQRKNTSRQRRARGGHALSELINHPLLLVDLIPQAGQLLVVQAAVRLPLLARSPLPGKHESHREDDGKTFIQ